MTGRRPGGPAGLAPRRTRCGAGGRRAWQQRSKPLPATRQGCPARSGLGRHGRRCAQRSAGPEGCPDVPARGSAGRSSPRDRARAGDGPAPLEVDDLTIRYGDHTAVDGLSFTADAGHGASPCSGPTAPARPRRSRPSRATAGPTRGSGAGARPRPVADHAQLTRRIGVMLQDGRRLHRHPTARGPAPVRRLLRRPRRPRRAARAGRAGRPPPHRPGASCRAASSSACRWPWPWSADPRWRSSTSPPPASIRAAAS